MKSQSHRTDQGSSKASSQGAADAGSRSRVAIPPYRSGQFQAIVRCGRPRHHDSKRRNPTVQIRAVPRQSMPAVTAGTMSTSRNPTVQIREVPSRSRSLIAIRLRMRSRNPTVQIRAVPRLQLRRTPSTSIVDVAIPPYRSGQFQASPSSVRQRCRCREQSQSHRTDQGSSKVDQGRPDACRRRCSVAIPPYRSGQFRARSGSRAERA